MGLQNAAHRCNVSTVQEGRVRISRAQTGRESEEGIGELRSEAYILGRVRTPSVQPRRTVTSTPSRWSKVATWTTYSVSRLHVHCPLFQGTSGIRTQETIDQRTTIYCIILLETAKPQTINRLKFRADQERRWSK